MTQPAHEKVLIVDFGSQVTQLIARRVRESGVYCEIHPFDKVDAVLEQLSPKAGVVSPRGDVSEHGAARFFRRTAEGVYDMADLAQRTETMAASMSWP